MVIYVCTSLPETLDSSACAKVAWLGTKMASSPQIWPLPHRDRGWRVRWTGKESERAEET